MANIKLIPSFKTEEEMKNFFTERDGILKATNQKIEDALKEAERVLKNQTEKVLYSITLPPETYVFLSVDAINNFYENVEHLYSKEKGIVLKKIKIVFCQYLMQADELSLKSSYFIKFIFGQKEFNNDWAEFPLDRLSFSDDKFKLVDNSMGACLDPRFADKEKYCQVKNFIVEVEKTLSKIEKENKKK